MADHMLELLDAFYVDATMVFLFDLSILQLTLIYAIYFHHAIDWTFTRIMLICLFSHRCIMRCGLA